MPLSLDIKPGMAGVDKAAVEARINEISRGSPFYQNEERKSAARRVKVEAIVAKAAAFDALPMHHEDRLLAENSAAQLVADAEAAMAKKFSVYVHIDMDMFFAAVEEKNNPALRDVPMAVGGMSMLCTSNYEARKYGVRAAMPGYIAKTLCPSLVIVPPNFPAYQAEAAVCRQLASELDPSLESWGLDEMLLHLTSKLSLPDALNAAEAAVETLRGRIFSATGLTASAGIAVLPTLAKIHSNAKKPNGQSTLRATTVAEVRAVVHALKPRAVPFVGRAMAETLAALGVESCADCDAKKSKLWYALPPATARMAIYIGAGAVGCAPVARHGATSVGHERTGRWKSAEELRETMRTLAIKAVDALHGEDGSFDLCRQVVLKLKRRDFTVKQRSHTLPRPSADLEVVWDAVDRAMGSFWEAFEDLRLVGVRLSIAESSSQLQRTLSDFLNRDVAPEIVVVSSEEVIDVDADDIETSTQTRKRRR